MLCSIDTLLFNILTDSGSSNPFNILTESGRLIPFNTVSPNKTNLSIISITFGIVTLLSDVQSLKAFLPILVTIF